jgi:hypothetical protein
MTPTKLVDSLLEDGDDRISAFVTELRAALAETGAGTMIGSETMVPEQTSLISIKLKSGEEFSVHAAALPSGGFDFMPMDANGDFGDPVKFKDVADFISKIAGEDGREYPWNTVWGN